MSQSHIPHFKLIVGILEALRAQGFKTVRRTVVFNRYHYAWPQPEYGMNPHGKTFSSLFDKAACEVGATVYRTYRKDGKCKTLHVEF